MALGEFSYRQAMRELKEEIELGCGYRERCLGLINDDSTLSGRSIWGSYISSIWRDATWPRANMPCARGD